VKILIISLVVSAGISVVTELLMDRMSVIAAGFVALFIMLLGIVFDLIGIAFATCDPTPFVSMASKKIKRAKSALTLLKSADVVSNICNDVVGDICGIVSGAAGAAIVVKIALTGHMDDFAISIAVPSIIAALTISGKAMGKSIAIKNNKQIVGFVSYVLMFFMPESKKNG